MAGSRGMVGSAIVRCLQQAGYQHLLLPTSEQLDLREQQAVRHFFESHKPEYVFLAAAKVGGILANNTYRAEFIYDNLAIQTHVIHEAYRSGVRKLLFLGSSCIYPKFAPQPIREEYLLTGALEPTNEPYAIAKIAGIKMCQAYRHQYGCNFICAMPTNLYGPGDNFDLHSSHVMPALIRKFTEAAHTRAKEVVVWGTGKPRREFLHVDDLAEACLFLMQHYDDADIINIGTGEDISIEELASLIARLSRFEGKIVWDSSKPDGTPRKLLDVSRIHQLGWHHRIPLEEGIYQTMQWYRQQSMAKC